MYYRINFASAYGQDTYNTSSYNGAAATSTGTTGGGTPSGGTITAGQPAGTAPATTGGTLANTGFELLVGATIGSIIIFSALVIRFWKKPAKNSAGQ